jgi:hypothetical protein
MDIQFINTVNSKYTLTNHSVPLIICTASDSPGSDGDRGPTAEPIFSCLLPLLCCVLDDPRSAAAS